MDLNAQHFVMSFLVPIQAAYGGSLKSSGAVDDNVICNASLNCSLSGADAWTSLRAVLNRLVIHNVQKRS